MKRRLEEEPISATTAINGFSIPYALSVSIYFRMTIGVRDFKQHS